MKRLGAVTTEIGLDEALAAVVRGEAMAPGRIAFSPLALRQPVEAEKHAIGAGGLEDRRGDLRPGIQKIRLGEERSSHFERHHVKSLAEHAINLAEGGPGRRSGALRIERQGHQLLDAFAPKAIDPASDRGASVTHRELHLELALPAPG